MFEIASGALHIHFSILSEGGGRRGDGAESVAGLSSGGGGREGGLLSLMSDGEPAANRNTEKIMQL